jgi:simple sugar transport system substrate-binding protein
MVVLATLAVIAGACGDDDDSSSEPTSGTAAGAADTAAPGADCEPIKAAFVYVGPIGDAGWTKKHDDGRKELETALGDCVETSYLESVPEGAESEATFDRLAREGNDVIFGTSFGYMDQMLEVAAKYPDVKFEHATGFKVSDNMSTYFGAAEEARYLSGMAAASVTESGQIGYVAAFPIPEVIRGINAFVIGMRSVNPNAKVRVVWVSSWYDPGKEREAAEALIAQGADVIMQHTDSTAPVQAAEAKGVYAIGYHSDMSKFGPKAHLVASTHNWTGYYQSVVDKVMKGQWKAEQYVGGIKEGMVVMAGWGAMVPDDVKKLVAEKEAAMKAGTLAPFQGPLKAQDGKEVVAAGKTMPDKDIANMSFYVQGVEGALPKK